MEKFDITLIALGIVFSIGGIITAVQAEKIRSCKWRLYYLAPLLTGIICAAAGGFDICMISAYIGMIILLAGLFKPEKKVRMISSVTAAVLVITALPVCMFSGKYHYINYEQDFEKGFAKLKAHYVLSEDKEINWEELHDKYLPRFRSAATNNDAAENYTAWTQMCAQFNDLHVCFSADEEVVKEAEEKAAGNDFGLVIATLSDGRTVAIQTDDTLKSKGIHDGTEIISWNGKKPSEADKDSDYYYMKPFADIDNKRFYEGWFAAGTGGDTAEVVYIDDDGNEQAITLSSLGRPYIDRYKDAYNKVSDGLEAGHMSFTKLNDTTACLRIKMMKYDSASENKDDHSNMKNEIRDSVLQLKEEGIKDIIIDIRCNSGGSGDMVLNIAELFAPEGEHYYVTDAYWDKETQSYVKQQDGTYKTDGDIMYSGENILGDDGRIVLLVCDQSVSASDHLTHVLNDLDNVTVIGFTEPSGSAQGCSMLSLESGMMTYSSSLMLNRDGSIFIDSGTDMQSGNGVDIKVPFDEKAINEIFAENKDYLMDYALEYLSNTD